MAQPTEKQNIAQNAAEGCNTVTFTATDGTVVSFPLDFLIERGAIIADKINGESIDYTNRPNVSCKAEYVGRVGEPMVFEGWADDFDKRIVAVEFSLDDGISWTRHETTGADAVRWVWWTFEWTPQEEGMFAMKVRSVNEDGKASPIPAVHNFQVMA